MFVKFLFFVCLGLAVGNTVPSYESFQQYNFFSCSNAGGICMEYKECPEGKQAPYKGLCLHKGRDAVCCYGLPLSETRCSRNGGECMPISTQCPLLVRRATDCTEEEKCCVLVN